MSMPAGASKTIESISGLSSTALLAILLGAMIYGMFFLLLPKIDKRLEQEGVLRQSLVEQMKRQADSEEKMEEHMNTQQQLLRDQVEAIRGACGQHTGEFDDTWDLALEDQ